MSDQIDTLLSWLNKLYGLPAGALVFVSCIAVGYVWRAIKFRWFANDAIPMAVMAWGAFFMCLIAEPRAVTMPQRVWFGRNVLVGLVIGLAAWLVHFFVLKWLEDKLTAKFPGLNDTTIFNKQSTKP